MMIGAMSSVVPSPVQIVASRNAASSVTSTPRTMRGFDAPERSMATSRSAASGGTRVARIAGASGGHEGDDQADEQGDHDGLAAEDDAAEVAAEAGEGAATPGRRRRAARGRRRRGRRGIASSSTEREHLAPAGADGPQQGQLAGALLRR